MIPSPSRLRFYVFIVSPLIVSIFVPLLFYRYPLAINVGGENFILYAEVFRAVLVSVLWLGLTAAVFLWQPVYGTRKNEPNCGTTVPVSYGLLGFSVAGGIVALLHEFFVFPGGVEQIIVQLSLAPIVGFVLAVHALEAPVTHKERWRVLLYVAAFLSCLMLFVIPIFKGNAAPPAYAALAILFGITSIRSRRRTRLTVAIVLAIFVAIALGTKQYVRTQVYCGTFQRIGIGEFLSGRGSFSTAAGTIGNCAIPYAEVKDGFKEYDPNYYNIRLLPEEYGIARLLHRINYLGQLAYVIRVTPSKVGYAYGETYYPLLFKFIPRLVWPGKPVDNTGQYFGHRYGFLNDTDMETSWNLNAVVEAWINGGWIAVVLSALCFGIVLRLMWIIITRWQGQTIGASLLLTVIVREAAVIGDSNLNLAVGGMIYGFIVFGAWVLAMDRLAKKRAGFVDASWRQ